MIFQDISQGKRDMVDETALEHCLRRRLVDVKFKSNLHVTIS